MIPQTFTENEQAPNTAIAILKGMDTFKADVKFQNVIERFRIWPFFTLTQ